MIYNEISRRERQVLGVLAANHVYYGLRGMQPLTTSGVVARLPENPSRRKVVSALYALEQADYVQRRDRLVFDEPGNGTLAAWEITVHGLRAALGALG